MHHWFVARPRAGITRKCDARSSSGVSLPEVTTCLVMETLDELQANNRHRDYAQRNAKELAEVFETQTA